MKRINESIELEKSKAHVIADMIEYMPKAKASTTIMKKITGNITVFSFSAGDSFIEKVSPFDIYIQVVAGAVELIINETKHSLALGQGIIIPAHARQSFNAGERCKILSTVIKSGYED